METDLEAFLSPAGSLLGDVTQRVLGFLSVQDLVQYVATSSSTTEAAVAAAAGTRSPDYPMRRLPPTRGGGWAGGTPSPTRYRPAAARGFDRRGGSSSGYGLRQQADFYRESRPSPEDELPHEFEYEYENGRGEGDEAGGSSRPPPPRFPSRSEDGERRLMRWVDDDDYNYNDDRDDNEEEDYGDEEAGGCWDRRRVVSDGQLIISSRKGGARDAPSVEVVVVGGGGGGGARSKEEILADGDDNDKTTSTTTTATNLDKKENPTSVLGVLIGLGLRPWTAFGAIGGGVAHLLSGVPLLALLRWATGSASALLGMTFRVALLPYDVTKGAVCHVVGSIEAMLKVATEVRSKETWPYVGVESTYVLVLVYVG